jgi:hypothetical protein
MASVRLGPRDREGPSEEQRRVNEAHPAGRQPGSTYWLIAKDQSGRAEMLTIECGGERALPVFSFEEEAELFLGLGGVGGGWWVRESGPGRSSRCSMVPARA